MSHNAPPQPDAGAKQPVLVISSHVMTGAVGNRAASFVLEAMAHPVWEVPTVLLPWHPGHGPSTRQTIDASLFSKSLDDITQHPDFASLTGVLTGYMGSVEQVKACAKLIASLRKANPEALIICDPVMGEENGLYIAPAIATAIRQELIPLADVITPNRFEFNWLTDSNAERNEELVDISKTLPCSQILITSAFALMRNSIANLLICKHGNEAPPKAVLCEHQAVASPPSGTGDMFAALYLAHKLAGADNPTALKTASSAIFEVVARSVSQGYRDLEVARFADRFRHPMAMVNLRQIGGRPVLAKPRRDPKRPPITSQETKPTSRRKPPQ